MVQVPEGGKVTVKVRGQEVPEYSLEEVTEGNTRTYTCFIEAVEGQEFTINVDGTFTAPGQILKKTILIDGKWADTMIWCSAGQPGHSEFDGFRGRVTADSRSAHAFTFSKMRTTRETIADESSKEVLKNACTINVDLVPHRRIGAMKHVPFAPSASSQYEIPVLPEDSKPALIGLTAVPGREIPTPVIQRCRCNLQVDEHATRTVVNFKYVPRSWLEARGIVEPMGDDDDDEVQLDSRRTERVAAKRRAREEREQASSSRNVRVKQEVKREASVKTEATIKEEEADSRTIETIDLTPDGDYVPPPRQIGDPVVIEDDASTEDS